MNYAERDVRVVGVVGRAEGHLPVVALPVPATAVTAVEEAAATLRCVVAGLCKHSTSENYDTSYM